MTIVGHSDRIRPKAVQSMKPVTVRQYIFVEIASVVSGANDLPDLRQEAANGTEGGEISNNERCIQNGDLLLSASFKVMGNYRSPLLFPVCAAANDNGL